MLGLDTNILVRYVVRDSVAESDKVDRLFRRELESGSKGFINILVLVELAWVLARTYRYSRSDILSVVTSLLDSEWLVFENENLVQEAVNIFRSTPVELADILINLLNREHGCRTTATFDRQQKLLPTATVL